MLQLRVKNIGFKLFHANAPFLYLLKSSEKQKFSDFFRRYRNWTLVRHGFSFIVILRLKLSCHEQVCLIRLRFERYFGWWEKYLSKRSLIKHTCSWRDKHIVLWTLNRQAKIKNIFIKQQYFYAYQTFIIILISTTSLHFSHWISPWLRAMLSYFWFSLTQLLSSKYFFDELQ